MIPLLHETKLRITKESDGDEQQIEERECLVEAGRHLCLSMHGEERGGNSSSEGKGNGQFSPWVMCLSSKH